MKPTPGPWEIEDDSQRIDGIGAVRMYRVVAPNGAVVAEFSNAGCNEIIYEDDGEGAGVHYDEQAMANATLIAAAPELYEALAEAVECGLVPKSSAADGGASRHSRQVACADMIRAALAKARGEQHT